MCRVQPKQMSASEGSELHMLLTSAFAASSCSALGSASKDATREQPEHVTGAVSSMQNCSFHEKLLGFVHISVEGIHGPKQRHMQSARAGLCQRCRSGLIDFGVLLNRPRCHLFVSCHFVRHTHTHTLFWGSGQSIRVCCSCRSSAMLAPPHTHTHCLSISLVPARQKRY